MVSKSANGLLSNDAKLRIGNYGKFTRISIAHDIYVAI